MLVLKTKPAEFKISMLFDLQIAVFLLKSASHELRDLESYREAKIKVEQ